ncbi:DEAD-box ATP-dependent RNA helicase 58, chloroplastic [Triticum urartu]|uniref:RNA helicase n=1 Tax=Triticum urartu TaxID=4572 RepID=M7YIZ7_TRIUA|nr:DEAD-box ATP-dependent RNA helicase 58, chloroplastic [Triticum urartu]
MLSGCARTLPSALSSSARATRLVPFAPRSRPRPFRAAAATLREVCSGRVPDHVLQRAEDVGYTSPTEVQEQSLPVLLAGQDCILHAQTGSGKTLAYLLAVFSAIDVGRSSVQALVIVPTRELGIQAEPPAIIVATVASLCQMVEKRAFSLGSIKILVIDEVDFIFGSSKQVNSLRKILNSYTAASSRQTIFASASIPQHNRFVHDCVQHKWTKSDVVHVHVNPVQPMPSHLHHTYVICSKKERLHVLLSLLERDAPKSVIIFVAQQSEKSKRAGNPPSSTLVVEFLRTEYKGTLEVLVLEEDMNFNARATSFTEVKGKGFLLVSTDIASRGFDLPQTSHIYNFDLPKTATDYLHRAGRTGREPFSKSECSVTTLITEEEHFVLQRFQNELKFHSQRLPLESMFTFNMMRVHSLSQNLYVRRLPPCQAKRRTIMHTVYPSIN